MQRTQTTNGAGAFTSTSNPLVDFFFNVGASRNNLEGIRKNFKEAFKSDPLKATAIMLWARDIRHGGAGERQVFRTLLKELLDMKNCYGSKVINLVPEIGRFDDLKIAYGTNLEDQALNIWANAIKGKNVLASKWAKRDDKKLQKALGLNEAGLRKLLSSIRKNVIPEAKMCANEWDQIEYSKLPSVCGMRNAKAFRRHDGERYQEFLDSKETKVNASVAYPHDVYRMWRYGNEKDAASKYWENLPDLDVCGNILPIVDTSGSMCCPASGQIQCIDVAISLGVYLSQRIKGAFQNTMLTFSERPTLVQLPKTRDIGQLFSFTQRMNWGMNTNFKAAYMEVLKRAQQLNISQDQMPEYILCLSDMDFDGCGGRNFDTAFEDIKKEFTKAGYNTPKLIFWNLEASGHFPTSSLDGNVGLVSGFSPMVLKAVLQAKEVTTVSIMEDAIKPFVEMLK